MCDYANLHRYTYVFIFFLSRYIQRGPFVHFSMCVCAHVLPPADSPHLCLTAWQIYITKLTCWHAGGMKDNYRYCHGNCGPAVTRDLQCHDAVYAWVCVCVCLCKSVCMCVKEMEWGVAVAYRGWMFFSRGIVCDTAGRWQGLQPQPEVNNMTTLLVPVQKTLYISEWLPWQLGAESGPNFVLDSLIQMSCSAFCGRFLLNVFLFV